METHLSDQAVQRYKTIIAILIVVLVSNVSLFALAFLGWSNFQNNAPPNEITTLNNEIAQLQSEISSLTSTIASLNLQSNVTYAGIYDNVSPSVVTVQGVINGGPGNITEIQGSGFVYTYSGSPIIVTNNHVVAETSSLTISFESGDSYTASVLGTDPYSDLAVLSTTAPTQILKPLILASSSSLRVGQVVIAVGTPYGFTGSMTTGVVSQLGRSISETSSGRYLIADIIQTSTPINPGNSGGPLLNVLGEVVGITTAIIANSQGLGFAIPSDTILRELPYLVNGQPYPHPWLGITGIDVTYDLANAIGLNVTYGWMIGSVTPLGPAALAGMRSGTRTVDVNGQSYNVGGDVIIAINGSKIRNGDDLSRYLETSTRAGQTIQVTVLRSSQKLNLNVTLGTRPTS